MRHIRTLTSAREALHSAAEPAAADAKANLINSLYWSFQDLLEAKKTAVPR